MTYPHAIVGGIALVSVSMVALGAAKASPYRRKAELTIAKMTNWLLQPIPLRFLILASFSRHFGAFRYTTKLKLHAIERPEYGHCLLQAARLAQKLGHTRISAIEFGVGGGNGLVALERHAEHILAETGVGVEIYGFDTGVGTPAPRDHRDLPYLFQAGSFAMDERRLKARLRAAKLLLGPVEETVGAFCEREKPPPIGFVSFDLDYYSSTMAALKILDAAHTYLLPRVSCYFGDMVGDVDRAFSEFTGELLAINDFNAAHDRVKLAQVRGLRFSHLWLPRLWHEQIFVAHLFQHSDYGRPISPPQQAPLIDR